MAYSDYGGLAFKNWQPYPEALDASLRGFTPTERPLEAATGMKLDVLLGAAEHAGKEYGKEDWITEHAHHVVLGSMKGLAIVAHKQSAQLVIDGERGSAFNDDYTPDERFSVAAHNGWLAVLDVAVYDHSSGVLLYLRSPDADVWCGIAGYGIGDNLWWHAEHNAKPGARPWRTDAEHTEHVLRWARSVDARRVRLSTHASAPFLIRVEEE